MFTVAQMHGWAWSWPDCSCGSRLAPTEKWWWWWRWYPLEVAMDLGQVVEVKDAGRELATPNI